MSRGLLWRGAVVAALAALALWRAWPLRENVNLGLDLQGGIHLVLRVETRDAVKAETEKDMEVLRREAADEGIAGLATAQTGDTTFEVSGFAPDRLEALEREQ